MSKTLPEKPQEYDFFQAVRLLERDGGSAVGSDASPASEAVFFRTHVAHAFSSAQIADIEEARGGPTTMTVPFLGLVGPNGALPLHYTRLILERLRRRDSTLRDFLDLFNHRIISHFYRAWEKNHFPIAYERNRREQTVDLFTECLYCLVGRGTDGLRDRRSVADETYLFYAGQFAQGVRSATSLQMILADYTGLPLSIKEFVGQWLYLGEANQSYLATGDNQTRCNSQLGGNVVLGERVWDIQSKFRITIGPISYRDFFEYTPTQRLLPKLLELARSFVGPEFDFDVQLILKAEEVPQCVLGGTGDRSPRLGWNTWIQSSTGKSDAADAVFGSEAI